MSFKKDKIKLPIKKKDFSFYLDQDRFNGQQLDTESGIKNRPTLVFLHEGSWQHSPVERLSSGSVFSHRMPGVFIRTVWVRKFRPGFKNYAGIRVSFWSNP